MAKNDNCKAKNFFGVIRRLFTKADFLPKVGKGSNSGASKVVKISLQLKTKDTFVTQKTSLLSLLLKKFFDLRPISRTCYPKIAHFLHVFTHRPKRSVRRKNFFSKSFHKFYG